VICAVAGEWGSRPVSHVVSFIQIRRNHSRKIHTVELKSVNTKSQRLGHRVLRNSRFCFTDVQNNEIINFSLLLFTPIFALFSSTCIVSIFIQIGYRNNYVMYSCTLCLYSLCNKSLLKKMKLYILFCLES
jgi:hypothetical protein